MAVLARNLELDPALSRDAAARRVAHIAMEEGLEGLDERLLRLASQFTQHGVINPHRLIANQIRPYFFLASGKTDLWSQVIRDSERARDGVSQYVVFGRWDSLLVLYGSADEATALMERLQQGAYQDSVRFVAQDVLLAFRHRARPEYSPVPDVTDDDINDLALDYDNEAKRALRDSLLAANILIGPTLMLAGQCPYPITAFIGIRVRTWAAISGQEVLDALLRQEDLQRCMVDLYEIDHGVPFHYFAKIACATIGELDAATNAVAFASSGSIRFEGETLVVAQGSEQLPLLREADVASLMVAPDISPIARGAQRAFENLGAEERATFNSLTGERQLATLRALVGLQSATEGESLDADTQRRVESAIATFARESTKRDGAPNLTGAVVEVTTTVENLARTFLSRLAYSVCGKDPARIQRELQLANIKFRTFSLGRVVQAFRAAAKSQAFAEAHHRVPEEWVDRLDAFADERNSWAHGAAPGIDLQLVDHAFVAMREGIALAGWLAGELEAIRAARPPGAQLVPGEYAEEDLLLKLAPRARGSEFSVFVSHSATDGPTAERLALGLQAMGYNSWYAEWELKAGDSIVAKINAALSACDVLIVALSPRSVASSWVNRELNAALMAQLSGQQVLVIPVLIETCEIPPLLSDRIYADVREDFEKGFFMILDAIRLHRNKIEGQPVQRLRRDRPRADAASPTLDKQR